MAEHTRFIEPNNLCSTLIVYGSYAPGGENHHIFEDLPGEWVKGTITGKWYGPDELGPQETGEAIVAWTINFSDCCAEMFTPEWREEERMLYERWAELDRRMGEGWGRDTRRWWPDQQPTTVGKNGMIAVNIYHPLKHYPYIKPAVEQLKPLNQAILDIWVGHVDKTKHPNYFEEVYNDDDTSPLSEFVGDQGERWVDHDFMEMSWKDEPHAIAELASNHSWHGQYLDELTERVVAQGIDRANSFVSIMDDQVREPRTVEREGIALHYVGKFTIQT